MSSKTAHDSIPRFRTASGIGPVCNIVCSVNGVHRGPIYTTIGGLSSTFDGFLAGGRNSTAIMSSIFMRLHVANPRRLCDRFLRFIVLCFVRKKNNVAFHHRRHVYAARLMILRNRSIALRELWCHHSTAD